MVILQGTGALLGIVIVAVALPSLSFLARARFTRE
jgi:hypothetical protein